MPLKLVRNDITRMKVDAIVNAANRELRQGGGVCGAIFEAAGSAALQEECDSLAPCAVGQAVITRGYGLPAKHVIHTVGPVWQGGSTNEESQLQSCYRNSLILAAEKGLKSVAFPLIASGIYGYPKEEALHIAMSTIAAFLTDHEMTVTLVLFDKEADGIGGQRYPDIARYIDDHYVETHTHERGRQSYERALRSETLAPPPAPFPFEKDMLFECSEASNPNFYETAPLLSPKRKSDKPGFPAKRSLADVIAQLDETFSECLLRRIDEKGMTDVEVYKRANIDRKLFSKIRAVKGYTPRKSTAVAFAIALRLNLDETQDLLKKAGYTLSNSSRFDLIIAYFIEEGTQDIHTVNEALFQFDEPLLGA